MCKKRNKGFEVLLIVINNAIISVDLFRVKFFCDISQCKGHCCVEGDSGAPLEKNEIPILEKEYSNYKPFMDENGIKLIKNSGHYYIKENGDFSAPMVDGKECAYSFEKNGVFQCAIEAAYNEGKISFPKPISCHLYPIRIKILENNLSQIYYDKWDVCQTALKKGVKNALPLYMFLKDPLIRKFGKDWYDLLLEKKVILDCE